MADILYPAKKLRHKFAKSLHNTYREEPIGEYVVGGGVSTAVLTAALLGGGLAMQEPPEVLMPDTDAAPQAVQLAENFKSEIRTLAEERAAFLSMKQGSAFTSDEELLAVKQTGNEMGQRSERLVGRIVMSDALSETQAAELLAKFSDRVAPISDMGFVESSFGYLRESRAAAQENPGTDWQNISKEVTQMAAAREAADSKQMGTGDKVVMVVLMSLLLGAGGGLGGLLTFFGAMGVGGTRTVRRWAENQPKPKKPYAGH
ncbi:MAG: hypothetical protein EA357_06455 [Micavibrio sp.]|nr:MAG: hypothetical protein EA357_06455 [Micavibrio sp.]